MDKSTAHVVSINISNGGIPKLPINMCEVTEQGLRGDGHNHDKHNTPIQAVSIQDIEKLEELNVEGYALSSGMTGENLTVRNLNVNELPLGTKIKFSGGVIIELTKVRKPCYVLDAINPELKIDILGRCGMYAKVIQKGTLTEGERIQTELMNEKKDEQCETAAIKVF